MGKHEFFSPKAIANRIKSKGLQKLRWWCEPCQKQCRDENGFKCHALSEAHIRMMKVYRDNKGKFTDNYTQQFLHSFLRCLKRQYGTKRVYANQVYQQIVREPDHVHMNSTRWTTLTGFVQFLGTEGYCKVDETDKGWYITLIDRDPNAIARARTMEKEERRRLDDEQRHQKVIMEQVRKGLEAEGGAGGSTSDTTGTAAVEGGGELRRADPNEKIALELKPVEATSTSGTTTSTTTTTTTSGPMGAVLAPTAAVKGPSVFSTLAKQSGTSTSKSGTGTKRKLSAMEELMLENEAQKKRKASAAAPPPPPQDLWIAVDLIVKVVHKTLEGGAYYKRKGVVTAVADAAKYLAEVEMLDSGDVLRLDQKYLETVIPNEGRRVRVVLGAHRGATGTLCALDVDRFVARVRLVEGPSDEKALPYEYICKFTES